MNIFTGVSSPFLVCHQIILVLELLPIFTSVSDIFSPWFQIHAKNITKTLHANWRLVCKTPLYATTAIFPPAPPAPSLAVAQWHRIHTWQYNQVENYLFSCHQNINIVNTTDHYNCYKLGQRTSNFEAYCLDREHVWTVVDSDRKLVNNRALSHLHCTVLTLAASCWWMVVLVNENANCLNWIAICEVLFPSIQLVQIFIRLLFEVQLCRKLGKVFLSRWLEIWSPDWFRVLGGGSLRPAKLLSLAITRRGAAWHDCYCKEIN